MEKVYVVYQYEPDDYMELYGVFSSEDKALEYIDSLVNHKNRGYHSNWSRDDFNCDEFILDQGEGF